MASQLTKRKLAIGAAALAAGLLILVLGHDADELPQLAPAPGTHEGLEEVSPPEERGETGGGLTTRRADRRPSQSDEEADAEAADYLREAFGATISNKHTQIKAIEKLIAYLMKRYPDDWESRLQALLGRAFPGLAGQLWAQYQTMKAFNEWMRAHRDELGRMTPAERRAALNEARERYFGEDAKEIWEQSLKQERIFDAMDSIRNDHERTVDEKLETYLNAIGEVYGEQTDGFIENRQTELLTNFLKLDSVQDDLHAMTPAERAAQMDSVRRDMGLDEAARGRWRELDAQRDAAWETGERYMEARGRLEQQYQGEELAQRLEELRTQTFGDEAATIRAEEESGFFRFGHRRVYGRE